MSSRAFFVVQSVPRNWHIDQIGPSLIVWNSSSGHGSCVESTQVLVCFQITTMLRCRRVTFGKFSRVSVWMARLRLFTNTRMWSWCRRNCSLFKRCALAWSNSNARRRDRSTKQQDRGHSKWVRLNVIRAGSQVCGGNHEFVEE